MSKKFKILGNSIFCNPVPCLHSSLAQHAGLGTGSIPTTRQLSKYRALKPAVTVQTSAASSRSISLEFGDTSP